MASKNNKFLKIVYAIVIVLGIVIACSNLVPNDYVKLLIVFVALGFGLHGLLKGLTSTHSEGNNNAVQE